MYGSGHAIEFWSEIKAKKSYIWEHVLQFAGKKRSSKNEICFSKEKNGDEK